MTTSFAQCIVKPLPVALLALLLLCCCPKSSLQTTGCPDGWNLLSGSCVLANVSVNVTWCDANRECAKLGAELLTNFDVISNLRSTNHHQILWVGVSDLANERAKKTDGWQFVNGRGVMINASSAPNGPWFLNDPNNQPQDCVMFTYTSTSEGLMDKYCDDATAGFVCELKPDPPRPSCGSAESSDGGSRGRTRWRPQPIRPSGSEANLETQYCWLEKSDVPSPFECSMLAGSRPYSRSFFYNSATGRCRVLEFSDSQTSLDVSPSSGWVKYLRV